MEYPTFLAALGTIFAVTSLVAIRGNSKTWAQIRLIAYPVTAVFYLSFAVFGLVTGGTLVTVLVAAYLALLAGNGALGVRRAWVQGDYRPKHLRKLAVTPQLP